MFSTKTLSIILLVLTSLCLPACWKQQEAHAKSGLFVINVLDKNLYDDCHIKGSLSVPYEAVNEFVASLDKETAEIVFYCSNYMCTASGSLAAALKSQGFKKVWAYEGGMAQWYQLGLPYEGPAKQAYLSKDNQATSAPHEGYDTITAAQLNEMIKKAA